MSVLLCSLALSSPSYQRCGSCCETSSSAAMAGRCTATAAARKNGSSKRRFWRLFVIVTVSHPVEIISGVASERCNAAHHILFAMPDGKPVALQAPQQDQNQQDDDNRAGNAARAIAPGPAVRPGRQGADEDQDKYDQ